VANTKHQPSEAERDQRRTQDRERLRAGAEQLLCSEGWQRWVRTRASNGLARYSLTNQLLGALQSDGRATFVAGFKQWLVLGYCVKRGSRAIRIMAPMPAKQRDRRTGEETGETLVLFKTVPVFFQEQVEPLPSGEPAPLEPPREPLTGDSHAYLLPRLVAFCKSLGYSVRSSRSPGPPAVGAPAGQADRRRLGRGPERATADARARDRARPRRRLSAVLARAVRGAGGHDLLRGLLERRTRNRRGVDRVCGGWGEDGALEAVGEFAATIDALARRIEDALATNPSQGIVAAAS
jgi:hypothetical protein